MNRFATIDVGSNTVLLLVAEKDANGQLHPVVERSAITRLGRGVDKSGRLHAQNMEDTLQVLESFAQEARALNVEQIAVCATSASRDASNGPEFLEAARKRCNLEIEIISGEQEAQLSYLAADVEFGAPDSALMVIDIGGGSTEVIVGAHAAGLDFRHSFNVGSVRMSERHSSHGEYSVSDVAALRRELDAQFASLPTPPISSRVVGMAGTITTLFCIQHGISPYDASAVHGKKLSKSEVLQLAEQLSSLPLAKRMAIRGLEPKRADVIPAGAWILHQLLEGLKVEELTVSDRGLRWGLLYQRFLKTDRY